MRLENLGTEGNKGGQAELEQLGEDLRRSGYEVEVARFGSPVRVILGKSAEGTALDVLNVVLNEVEAHALDAVVGGVISVLMDWGRRRRHFRARSGQETEVMAVLWGPKGKVIRRVPLPKPEDGISEGDVRP
jgi:hypothetical protein